MQGIEVRGLEELDERFARVIKEAPEARRAMHGRIADRLKAEVGQQMDASGLNSGGGNRKWHSSPGSVKSWQREHVGSGGGYAAVRPESTSTGRNSPGAITDYLESGHPVRVARGKAKRAQKSRRKVASVRGYHFYQAAKAQAQSIAVTEANAFVDEIASKMEG